MQSQKKLTLLVQPLHEEIESESFVSEAGKKLGQRAKCVSWDSFTFLRKSNTIAVESEGVTSICFDSSSPRGQGATSTPTITVS